MTTIPSLQSTFGVELEMTHSKKVPQQISEELRAAGFNARVAKRNDKDYTYWHVTSDASIRCAPHQPDDCSRFEMVSPILEGEKGFEELAQVVRELTNIGVEVNESCGCHVHLGLGSLQLEQLKQVALAFVQLEEAIFDQVVHNSRRGDRNKYCRSNKQSLLSHSSIVYPSKLFWILNATTINDLAWAVQTDGRNYKMNLLPLRDLVTLEAMKRFAGSDARLRALSDCQSTPKPTIEFRQLGATKDAEEICNWVRLLQRFVYFAVVDFSSCEDLVRMELSAETDSRFTSLFMDAVQLFPCLGQPEARDSQ